MILCTLKDGLSRVPTWKSMFLEINVYWGNFEEKSMHWGTSHYDHIATASQCIALIFYKNINVKSMYISVKLPLLTIVYIYIALKLTLKSIHWTYFERKINALHCIDLFIHYIALPCLALKLLGSHNTLPCFALIKKRPHRHTLYGYKVLGDTLSIFIWPLLDSPYFYGYKEVIGETISRTLHIAIDTRRK